tara:strand:+ start:60 stop:590 length:531 start_codon:yes stop_codon:yes gene_type:complete
MSEYKKASAYIATVNKNAAKPQKKRLAPRRRPTAPHRRPDEGHHQPRGFELTSRATKAFHKGKMVEAKQTAKDAGKRYAQEAKYKAKTKPGTVSKDVQKAGVKLKAQMAGRRMFGGKSKDLGVVGSLQADPAKVLRRPNINDLLEIDKAGLSFPSLHDEFQKTMSLLHGGDVGDHL